MITQEIEVTNPEGLHTRPANAFVKEVKAFASAITITKNGTEVPGKSLLKIMKLGIVQGDTVTLSCEGSDESDAMKALVTILQSDGTGS